MVSTFAQRKWPSQNDARLVASNPDDKPLLLLRSGILLAPRRAWLETGASGLVTSTGCNGANDQIYNSKKTERHSAWPVHSPTPGKEMLCRTYPDARLSPGPPRYRF